MTEKKQTWLEVVAEMSDEDLAEHLRKGHRPDTLVREVSVRVLHNQVTVATAASACRLSAAQAMKAAEDCRLLRSQLAEMLKRAPTPPPWHVRLRHVFWPPKTKIEEVLP